VRLRWVRNLRVAGSGELRIGRKNEAFRAREIDDDHDDDDDVDDDEVGSGF